MRALVAGSTGIIGEALVAALERRGDQVVRLVRPGTAASGVVWDPAEGRIEPGDLEGFDAVFALGGRSIGERRWSDAEKRLIRQSRVDPMQLLAGALGNLSSPPATLVAASAVGFYGDRGDEPVDESSAPGSGFMADLCVAWERAAGAAADAGVRTVHLRTGVVVSPEGGVLGRILAPFGPRWLSPFRWGLGGVVGRGRQWMPWISLQDQVAAMLHVLDGDLSGPVNLVAPQPVTHRMFIKALGRALRRPTVLPIPPFVIHVLFGRELADALLGHSQKVVPRRLEETGFRWSQTDIEGALRDALA